MKIVLFYHSLISDWNHGNGHFLRGIATELKKRGHDLMIYEPKDAWSVSNLVKEVGEESLMQYREAYPTLSSVRYRLAELDLNLLLADADMVIVHEWNDHELVRLVGEHHRQRRDYVLFFHDTHHRSVTESAAMARYDLSGYDGVLAFGDVVRDIYRREGWSRAAWTWHEAADVNVFYPRTSTSNAGDVIWIGNWGDDERTAELHEYLLKPVSDLKLSTLVFGVRYPEHALRALREAGVVYGGWLPNYSAPAVFAKFKVTVHVPRRPYVEGLSGIPTIRPFEAMACGIPLISAPWNDSEHLFTPGEDFLVARNGMEMKSHLREIIDNPIYAAQIAERGLSTILRRHTCKHRVDQLMDIYSEASGERSPERSAPEEVGAA